MRVLDDSIQVRRAPWPRDRRRGDLVTPEQAEHWREMRANGARVREIAQSSGRPWPTVYSHVRDLPRPPVGVDRSRVVKLYERGLSQAAIARLCGVTRQRIYQIVSECC